MPRYEETNDLRVVGVDAFGREARLSEVAATAWRRMCTAAELDGVRLLLLSAFRSVERQVEIIRRKLAAGQSLDEILRVNAYPGFSEHHTGHAVDVGSPSCEHFSKAFEQTREFAWLATRAERFGFHLSYPRGNPHGIAYEPWHWRWRATTANALSLQ